MLIKYANVRDIFVPSFAYVICEAGEQLYTPVYNRQNRVEYFTEVRFEHTQLIEIKRKIDIKVGNHRIYAYGCNGKAYLGTKKEIAPILNELLDSNAIVQPFCLLEVIDFLRIRGLRRNQVLNKCHDYLQAHATQESVEIWKETVGYKQSIRRISNDTPVNYNPKQQYLERQRSGDVVKVLSQKAESGKLTPQGGTALYGF
jgi:hypothetical protein